MEVEKQQVEEQLKEVKANYQKVAKELRTVKREMVSRKDYD